MSNVPSISSIKFIRKLKKAGFVFKRQAAGSHEIWFNPITQRTVTVPNHKGKDFKKGTLVSMINDTGLSQETFFKL